MSKVTLDLLNKIDLSPSLISICLQKKIPLDLTLFLGSLAGAQSVESLGNSESLNKFRLLRNLEYLLK